MAYDLLTDRADLQNGSRASAGLEAIREGERIRSAPDCQTYVGRSEIERAHQAVVDGALPSGTAAILVDSQRP